MYAAETTHHRIKLGLFLESRGGPLRWAVEYLDGPRADEVNVLRLCRFALARMTEPAELCWAWRVGNALTSALLGGGYREVDTEHTHGAPAAWDWRSYTKTRAWRLYRRSYKPTTAAQLRALAREHKRVRRRRIADMRARREIRRQDGRGRTWL